ncbi:MAG: PAS domain S-box protein [Planctomycetota bacterium]|nr:PAS domain S-box protein [Planctomycetota bacterium]
MSDLQAVERESALSAELRWFVALRWAAGLTIIAGTLVNAAWTDWTGLHGRALWVGAAILAYNALLFALVHGRTAAGRREGFVVVLAWCQILLDLACLTLLALWTGGLGSPLLGLFVLHMVFASLLLPPPSSYAGAAIAVLMLLAGLRVTDQWPADQKAFVLALGWIVTLLLTVFVANHITGVLRARQTALRRQHRRTRAIVDTAANGIVTFDETGGIESVNPAVERIFGYSPEELIGAPIEQLAGITPAAKGENGSWRELSGRRKDGSAIPLEVAVSAVRLGDKRVFTAIIRDITQHKRAEAELRALNEELKRQQQALVQHEKLAAMGQMAAGVAHEISNPLANMDGVLQLIERQPDRLRGETVEALREQVARIHRIVRQMTYFAHPDEACWETLPINDVVESALAMVRFDRRLRDVKVQHELSPSAGEVTMLPHAVQQVLVNLVLNALDAMEGAADPRLSIVTRRECEWCIIEVADNGRGIAPDDLPHIFEPFFTTKPAGKGTGLGLPISDSLIERHDGRCEVKSTPGRGTRFLVWLPVSGRASRGREGEGSGFPDSENFQN